MTEQEAERIADAKIVYVVAVGGCGKTFTGDYLHAMHGYDHVDGDGPLKNCHLPKNREMTVGVMTCLLVHYAKKEDGPEETWHPYFGELAHQTIEAAKQSNQVVLSHLTYRQVHREFVVEKLVEGGATRENIT